MLEDLQDMYKNSTSAVRAHSFDEATAAASYEKFIQFVQLSIPSGGALLDVGCGSGWSSYFLSERNYQTVGVDLNAAAFEPPTAPNLTLIEASALDLPFDPASFDVITSYQMIEHVPDPKRAIEEMVRVLKPGGFLCLAGPNLLSLGNSMKGIFFYAWRNRPIHTIFLRTPDMPRHPLGNTLFEALGSLPSVIGQIILKSLSSKASFSMREPDLKPPFHADNDACYLLNPIDMAKFLPTQGCTVIRNGYPGRPSFLSLLAGGTWIVAKKMISGPV